MVLEVLSQIHRGHTTFSEDSLDPVLVGERLAHPGDLSHFGRSGSGRYSRLGGGRGAAIEAEMSLFRQWSPACGTGSSATRHAGESSVAGVERKTDAGGDRPKMLGACR